MFYLCLKAFYVSRFVFGICWFEQIKLSLLHQERILFLELYFYSDNEGFGFVIQQTNAINSECNKMCNVLRSNFHFKTASICLMFIEGFYI